MKCPEQADLWRKVGQMLRRAGQGREWGVTVKGHLWGDKNVPELDSGDD